MRIHHRLFKPLALVALLFLGATGSCFAQCNIIAEAATGTHDGKVHIAPNGAAAFALSTTNVGKPCTVTVEPLALVNGSPSIPSHLSITLCQTNPQNALCFNPPSPASTVSLPFLSGEDPTFSVFLQAAGTVAPGAEVCVLFIDSGGHNDGQVCVPVVSS